MAWYHRRRERPNRMPDGKLAPAPTAEKQETKLAEAEEFKPAPLFMEEAPVATAKGELVPASQAAKPQAAPAPAPQAKAKPTAAPAPAPRTTSTQSTSKPAPKPKTKTLWGSLLGWGKSAEDELEKDLAKDIAEDTEKEKQAQAKPAPKKYYEQPQPEKKPEAKPKQETAVADKFKPAPIAMSTNLPAPASAKPAPVAKPAASSSSKPAAKQTAVANPYTQKQSRLTPEEEEEIKAKEAKLEAQFKAGERQRGIGGTAGHRGNYGMTTEEIRAYVHEQRARINELAALATQRGDLQAAAAYRKMGNTALKCPEECIAQGLALGSKGHCDAKPVDATKLPQHAKPTLDQYLANPSRYGATVKPKSTYKPTAADVSKQPFQAPKSACTGWGYKAAENCKTCRAMDDTVHCPCECGGHIPIDRNYNPFGGEESPSFKGGNPKGGRPW